MCLWAKILEIGILITVIFSDAIASKLNARRVLLPYNIGVPTNFTLEVNDGGCYQWSSSRPDVAIINPIYDPDKPEDKLLHCSKTAKVTVTSHSPRRLASIVVAKEVDTGLSNRVDIEVDVIKRIEIVTRTKEIALDDVPEIIEVRAMNAENDTFSSIGGIEFEWVLEPVSVANQALSNLRFKKFSESSYKVLPDVEYWESRDAHGAMVLIQGTRTGASKVRAEIKDAAYKSVAPAEITLVVIANLLLIPSHNVFLIPHATIKYDIELIKSGEIHELTMPSDQYYLEITNSKVASLNAEEATVRAISEGMTELVLKDRNIKLGDGVRQPTVEVYIKRPSYLTISISPGKNFALQELTEYVVEIQIFDDYHHRIFPSDNLDLQVTFPDKFFTVAYNSPNGSYSLVQTLTPGSCRIKAKLIGAYKENREVAVLANPVELQQEVKIYPKLITIPSIILLPWDPIVRPSYLLYPRAKGATGIYHWESTNPSVAGVTFSGESKESSKAVVRTNTSGNATLIVTDIHNVVFRNTIFISVQPINEIEIVANVLETQVGSPIYLPLALYGFEDEKKATRRVFDDCSKVPIDVEVVEPSRFIYDNTTDSQNQVPGFNKGCRTLQFNCISPGHSRIFVRYKSGDSKTILQTTAVISCHLPLKLIHPKPFGLLALGTSLELTFEGGPRLWPLNKEGHYTRLSSSNTNLYEMQFIADPYRYKKDLHVFKVTCKELGESDLELAVGNLASPTLPNPAIEKVKAKLACGTPLTLHLRPKLKSDDNCPLSQASILASGAKLPISATRDSEIEIFAKDVQGRKFYNISSLFVTWQVSDYTLAKLSSYKFFHEEVNGASGYRRLTRSYQTIKPLSKEGDLSVEAIATSYRAEVLSKEGVKNYKDISSELRAVATLTLVSKPEVTPKDISILNHSGNKVNLQLSKGSGHFLVEPSITTFASVNYSETSKTISLLPLKNGFFTIKVVDCCVDHGQSSGDAMANVRVVYPKEIQVKFPEKLELNKESEIVVRVLDNTGVAVSAIDHSLMVLRPIISSDIVSIKKKAQKDRTDKDSVFLIKGERLGDATIAFTTSSGYDLSKQVKSISSPEINLQIFVPLKIVPSNLTLVVGSIFQITVIGGPQPDAVITYRIEDDTVASITGSGIMNALKIGTTKLVANAIGHGSILYSQDQIIVEVVPLSAIKINAPVGQLLVGSEIPLFLTGLSPNGKISLSPFSFASVQPSFRIKWSVSNKDIIRLKGVVDDAGFTEIVDGSTNGQNMFSIRAFGIQAGSVSIKCTMEVEEQARNSDYEQVSGNKLLSSEVQIRIYPELKLMLPSGNKGKSSILMSPGSEFQLKTNRQGFAKLKYSLRFPSTKISIERGNILKASDIDENILLVTAQEEFGAQQSASYRIIVKPVSYLMLKPSQTFYKSSKVAILLTSVPVGSTMKFDVNYFDSDGIPFDAALSSLNVRPNRYDLIDIRASGRFENNSITVKVLKEGSTIVRAWDSSGSKDNILQDYIYIKSGHAIYPANSHLLKLVVGDVICFKSPLTSPEGQSGIWEVEGDEKSIAVDPSLGIAIAHKPGRVRMRYNLTSYATSSQEITIDSPKSISIDSKAVPFLSQTDTSLILPILVEKVDINLASHHFCNPESLHVSSKQQSSPFQCELVLSAKERGFISALIGRDLTAYDLFQCQIEFNYAKNINEIHLHPQKLDQNLLAAISSLEANITIFVSLQSHNSNSVLSTSLTLPFYPNFYVAQKEIILNDKSTLEFITISTTSHILSSIQVLYGNEDTENAVDVFPFEKPKSLTPLSSKSLFVVQIPVQIREISKLWRRETNEPLNVKIWSSLLRQTKTIIVKITWSGEGPLCPKLTREGSQRVSKKTFAQTLALIYQFAVEYYQILLTSVSTCLVMFIGYHVLTKKSRARSSRVLQVSPVSSLQSTSPIRYVSSTPQAPTHPQPLSSGHFSTTTTFGSPSRSPRSQPKLWSQMGRT